MVRKDDAESRRRHRELIAKLDEIDEQMDSADISIGDTVISERIDALRGKSGGPDPSTLSRTGAGRRFLGFLIVVASISTAVYFALRDRDASETPLGVQSLEAAVEELEGAVARLAARVSAAEAASEDEEPDSDDGLEPEEDPLEPVQEKLVEIDERLAALDAQLAVLGQLDPDTIRSLKDALEDLRETGGDALASLRRDIERANDRLDGLTREVRAIDLDLGQVERVTTTAIWSSIDEFLVAAESDFAAIQGARVPFAAGRRKVWTSTLVFPEANATEIVEEGRVRYLRATFSTDPERAGGSDAYQSLVDRLGSSLPSGWTSSRAVVSGAIRAFQYRRPADGASFVATLREVLGEDRRKNFVAAIELDAR